MCYVFISAYVQKVLKALDTFWRFEHHKTSAI